MSSISISNILTTLLKNSGILGSLSSILNNSSKSNSPYNYFSQNIQSNYSDDAVLDTFSLQKDNQTNNIETTKSDVQENPTELSATQTTQPLTQTTQPSTQTTQTATTTAQSVPEENPNYSVEDFVKDDAEVSKRLDMAERQSKFEQVGTSIVGLDRLYYTSDPNKVVNDYEKHHKGYSYAKQKYSQMISQHDSEINNQMQQYSAQHPNATKEELESYKSNLETQYRANNYDYKTYVEAKEAYEAKTLAANKKQDEINDAFMNRF